MKRKIRNGCFETNSSSTHAICISKENYTKRNFIKFEIGEFGWEFKIYDDLNSRASYLITAIFGLDINVADEKLQQLKDILNDNNIEYDIPTPEIKSYTYGEETEYYYDIDGYIDHVRETDTFVNAVLSDSNKLMRYLFGNSLIITGNDNEYDYEDQMYIKEDDEITKWGVFPRYGEMKPEFNNYEIYEKGN